MTRAGKGLIRTLRTIMTKQDPEIISSSSRSSRGSAPGSTSMQPAEEALTRLVQSELSRAKADAPALVEQCDPGRVWLLWFAIGATEEICRLTQRRANDDRDRMFRNVVATIFSDGVRSQSSPWKSPQQLIELFETAGTEAVSACMRGDTRLAYYLDALKVCWSLMADPPEGRAD